MKIENELGKNKARQSQWRLASMRMLVRCAEKGLRGAAYATVLSLLGALLPLTGFAQVASKGAPATANTPGVPALGTAGVNCVISAVNRNAMIESDASFSIFNIPANAGAYRGRVTCSDGSVGQTAVKFSSVVGGATVELGGIVWGKIDPVPTALGLTAPDKRLTTGGTSQLNATAIGINPDNSATTYNVTPRSAGTTYTISNDLLGAVGEDGLVRIHGGFAPGSSSRLVLNASTEGGSTGSYVFFVGPRGSLSGRVLAADGVTPIANAQVTVLRTQPREQVGTVTTNVSGQFTIPDVNAGPFQLTAIDPSNGDRAIANAKLETEGETGSVNLRMNGQGTVDVTVVSVSGTASNETLTPVPNAQVTLTALGAFLDTRTAATDASGVIRFGRVTSGEFTVSTRDRASGLVGAALGVVAPGTTRPITLRLQPVGTIKGIVYDVNGTTPRADIQVRVISRERGIVTQGITDENGAFSFAPLPLYDGPYTLDAFADGRLRARVPGLVLNQANQVLPQNITLTGVGTINGTVLNENRQPLSGALVNLQMTEGQRFAFEARTDAQGKFVLPAVLLGSYVLTAGKDTRTARLNGRLSADGEIQTVEMQLGGATVTGIVYERDTTTSVGSGTRVYLVPSGNEALTINGLQSGVVSTTTDAQSRYVMSIPNVGRYTIQAERGTDRGRTELAVTTLTPSQPYQANVVFLAKGTVGGVVRDPSGNLQANVAVTVVSNGAFRNSWLTTTDATGRYSIPGVFAGELTAFAQSSITNLAGYATNRVVSEGQALTADITLAATGTISGQVLKRNGSVVPGATKLELQLRGSIIATKELSNGSSYQFDRVPTTDEVQINAIEVATGDRGAARTRIETANQTRALNVQMVGLGTVRVIAVDENNNRVADADVTVATTTPFVKRLSGKTDVSGELTVSPLFAGDFTVNVSKAAQIGVRSGSATATLLADTEQSVTVTLTSRPLGTIKGVVFKPDGVTPAAGLLVRMTPEPSFGAFTQTTNAQGEYQFDGIEGGNTYTLQVKRFDNANCPRDRVRGQITGVSITTNDEIVTRNIAIFSAGRVFGKIANLQGTGIRGIRVSLVNPDPTFGANAPCSQSGTRFEAVSNDGGDYLLEDVPAGNFTITAENASRSLRAEGAGRVRFDADSVELNLAVVDSAVTMPQTLRDANAVPFDVRGDGSIGNGINNIFTGSGSETRGMRLSIITNNVAVPFQNGDGSVGRLTQGAQQIEVDENNASGLKVTRKIWVPRTGYFLRYLEVLENPTATPITVGVKVTSHHRSSDSNPRVVDSSDGDQVLSVVGATDRDRWVIVDDQQDADPFAQGSIPATGHLFDGMPSTQLGVRPVKNVNTANYELIGQTGKLSWQWDSVTVEPGKKVALMHFAFNQLDRARARQAATRLAQLPPEALENFEADERDAIVNFVVPTDSSGAIEKLPAVDVAVVSGKVVSGDGTTPIANARVHLKSRSALYGRDYYTDADGAGKFEFRAKTDGTADAIAIPLGEFTLDAVHPKTRAGSGLVQADFVVPNTIVDKDLVFNNTGNVRGVVRRHNGALVGDADVRLCSVNDTYECRVSMSNFDVTATNGTYLLAGSQPRNYGLRANKPHPQQAGGLPIIGQATTTVTSGDTTVADITMEQTGTLTGLVRAANGDPLQNAEVRLFFVSTQRGREFARGTTTDTAGRYRFFDARTGDVAIEVRDPVTQARSAATGVVTTDTETTIDTSVRGFGTIMVQVNFARGVAAANARVIIEGGNLSASGQTDTNGVFTFNAEVGTYSIIAWHPDDLDRRYEELKSVATATLAVQGASTNVTVTLKSAGLIRGTVVRADGSTLASGFPLTIRSLTSNRLISYSSLRTDSTGNYRFSPLGVGTWSITAYDPVRDRFADEEFVVNADGEEIRVDLRLEDNRIALPATLKDANRFPYDVQIEGKLVTGLRSARDTFAGASQLEVSGVAFSGDTSALLEATRRQFSITQPSLVQGIKVTRKVFVPRGGYFARYLEVFENTTASSVSLDVKIAHGMPESTQIVRTSSGDTSFNASNTWLVVDDEQDGDPLIAPQQTSSTFVLGQTNTTVGVTQANFATSTSGGEKVATIRWQNVSVPANGKIILMHFVAQQVNRAGAIATAERLQQLPPEALVSLSASELVSIKNFSVPTNGESSVARLPSLTAGVSGRVFEGDSRTPVVGVRVTLQSSHPLFNRIWGMQPNCASFPGTGVPGLGGNVSVSSVAQPNANPPVLAGAYRISGQLTDDSSIAVPEGIPVTVRAQEAKSCFDRNAGHSVTNLVSRIYNVNPSAEQDILFDSGVLTGTVIGYNDFSVTSGRVYLSTKNPYDHSRPIATDGSYVYPGLSPGNYDLLADTRHPQSRVAYDLRGSRSSVEVTLGQTTVTDLRLQPTGSLQGAVLTSNGEPSIDARIEVVSNAAQQTYDQCVSNCVAGALSTNKGKRDVNRATTTDSLGRYNFTALPIAENVMTVTDPLSNARKSLTLTVAENQAVVQNVTLLGIGTVNLTVSKAGGLRVVDANVYIKATALTSESLAGRTDAQGTLVIANIPTGAYQVRVPDPRASSSARFERRYEGTISTNGESQNVAVTLLPFARANVSITLENGTAAPASTRVDVSDELGLQTYYSNSAGRVSALVSASATIKVFYPQNPQISISRTLTLADDETRDVAMSFSAVNPGEIRGRVLKPDGSPSSSYVEAYRASDNGYLQQRQASNTGTFVFSGLPTGQELILRVSDGSVYVNRRVTLANDAGIDGFDLQLRGAGAVTGYVKSQTGTVVAGAPVYATFDNGYSPSAQYYLGNTDAQGRFSWDNAPVGIDIKMIAKYSFIGASVEVPVRLSNAGQLLSVDLVLPNAATLSVEVKKTSGAALSSTYRLSVRDTESNQSAYFVITPSNPRIEMQGIANRTYELGLNIESDSNSYVQMRSVTIATATNRSEVFVVGEIRGLVRYADNTPVTGATVALNRLPERYYQYNLHRDVNLATGEYVFDMLQTGEYGLTASDSVSGLTTSEAVVVIDNLDTGAVKNLAFTPTGSVRGVFTNAQGEAIPNAIVGITSGAQLRSVTTDANGAYVANSVSVGPISAKSRKPETFHEAGGAGILATQGDTLVINLQTAPSGTITGTVRDASGAPVSGVNVVLAGRLRYEYGPLYNGEYYGRDTVTVGDGGFSFADVAPGDVTVSVRREFRTVAGAAVAVKSNITTDLDLRIGSAVGFSFGENVKLDGADGFRYEVGCDGSIRDGGTTSGSVRDAFSYALSLGVADEKFPCLRFALYSENKRQLSFPAVTMSVGVRTSRAVYSPDSGGYVRYLDEFINNSLAPITFTIELGDASTQNRAQVDTSLQSTRDRFVVSTDGGSGQRPAIANVLCGQSVSSVCPTNQLNAGALNSSWSVTLTPSERKHIMTFVLQRSVGDISQLRSKARSIVDGVDPNMYDGIPNDVRAAIINFVP